MLILLILFTGYIVSINHYNLQHDEKKCTPANF